MAIVLTNGIYYIYLNNKGKHRKTTDIKQALQYNTVREAIKYMNIVPIKTEGFYVYDTFSNRTLWKRLTQEERIELQEQRNGIVEVERRSDGKIKRKKYSDNVKKLLYMNANGKCALCGRKLLFEDITIDHKIPLACGGADSVENLQICCLEDNQFKGSI